MLGSTSAYAQRSKYAAEKLVRAMLLDHFAVQGTLAAYLRKPDVVDEVRLTDGHRLAFLHCLEAADTSSIVYSVASLLARQMSSEEIQQALTFYNSFAGKKTVRRELAEAQKMLGFEFATKSLESSAKERASLERFKDTSAYLKLQEFPAMVRDTPEVRKAILQGSQLAAAACFQTVGLARQ